MTPKPFMGGLKIPHYKSFTEHASITVIPAPEQLVIPLRQHIGAPCNSLVKVGDAVTTGQKIGDSDAFVSAPVHASLSGRVTAVEMRPSHSGQDVPSVVIDVDDAQQPWCPSAPETRDLTKDGIIAAVKEAGIVGMGGAGFPTAVKLQPPADKPVDTVLLNGCECEPYLTCDHRVMVEMPEQILKGAAYIRQALGAETVLICVEDNKLDAVEALRQRNTDQSTRIVTVPTKYPQGAEKQLIKAVLGREVPPQLLPFAVGVVVQNVGTAVAVCEAVDQGKPLVERVVTVTGDNIADPKNLRVPVGTLLSHVIEQCGGLIKTPAKVIVGGPMTGVAQKSLSVPVTKAVTGITVLNPATAVTNGEYTHCVRCGRCVDGCPMLLYPNQISVFCEANLVERARQWNTMDCIECGICAYVCPSNRPIIRFVQDMKPRIQAAQRP